MTDIALSFDQNKSFIDIELNGADLSTNTDLYTAVIISLFSNARAQPGDPISPSEYQGGWWGDSYATINTPNQKPYAIGSRLWLLARQKATQDVANLAKQYCYEALQWMIDDLIVQSLVVNTAILNRHTLAINIQLTKPTGVIQTYNFNYVWTQI